jgi:hypothetical protein
MLFIPKLVGRPGQADQIVEFFKPDSDLSQAVNRDYIAFKEVERPKYLPGQIRDKMHEEGFPGFNMHHHTQLWKALEAKAADKGLGVDVAGAWYWYEPWVTLVRAHCRENAALYE